MWSMILNVALAGKLAEGYRGIPFGMEPILESPPSVGCSYLPDPSSKWECQQTIGEATVVTSYTVEQGIYYGVVVMAPNYRDSVILLDVMKAAYGPGMKLKEYQTGNLVDMIWKDGDVFATFQFNSITSVGTMVMIHRPLMEEMKQRKAAKAAGATSDL